MTTASELQRVARAHARASARLAEIGHQRERVVREAHEGGMTTRAIARAVGLSHQRVHQILSR